VEAKVQKEMGFLVLMTTVCRICRTLHKILFADTLFYPAVS